MNRSEKAIAKVRHSAWTRWSWRWAAPLAAAAVLAGVLVLRGCNGDALPPGPKPDPHLFATPAFGVYGSWTVAVEDFNGDGNLDVASAGKAVGVWLGNDDGTFSDRHSYGLGSAAQALAAANLNADAHADFVAGTSEGIHAFLGNGDGSFGGQPRITTAALDGMVVGDFNGDGVDDLASIHGTEPKLRLWMNTGDGGFADPVTTGPTPLRPESIISGDLNEDGNVDLIVHEGGIYGRNTVLLGNGEGGFSWQRYVSIRNATSMHLADTDGDGDLDLVTHDPFHDKVVVFAGHGDGTLQESVMTEVQEVASVVVGDLNGDARPDLIINVDVPPVSSELRVLLNDGNGFFSDEPLLLAPLGPDARPLAVADFDGDGHQDFLLSAGQIIWTEIGLGNGTFDQYNPAASVSPSSQPFGADPAGVTVGDVTGDGIPDMIGLLYDEISIVVGDASGAFALEATYSVGDRPTAAVVHDLDSDGDADIATVNASNDVSVLRGVGDGTFLPEIRFGVGGDPRYITVGDINGDGVPDLVVGNASTHYGDWGGGVSVLHGVGDCTFHPDVVFAGLHSVVALAIADVDLDGDSDVIAGTRKRDPADEYTVTGDLILLRNVGAGVLEDEDPLASLGRVIDLAVRPLANGDNYPDIVALVSGGNTVPAPPAKIHVMLGGEQNFTAASGSPSSMIRAGDALVVSDLDSDGIGDLVVMNYRGYVGVRLGGEAGTFGFEGQYRTKSGSRGLGYADFDGDGDNDLVVGSSGKLWILWNGSM